MKTAMLQVLMPIFLAVLVCTISVSAQTPQLVSPEEGSVLDNGCIDGKDNQVWEFSWSYVDGAQKYHLSVQRLGSQFPALNHAVDGTSFTFDRPGYVAPVNSDGWTWRVRALVNGKWRKWSPIRTFSVEPVDTDCPKQSSIK